MSSESKKKSKKKYNVKEKREPTHNLPDQRNLKVQNIKSQAAQSKNQDNNVITEIAVSQGHKKDNLNQEKYDVSLQTYEEIEDQEKLGADYEELIQTPFSSGSHFQFKHEKSWDAAVTSSDYDHYFDVNIDNLVLALNTIPFYTRNCVAVSLFSENDITDMNNKAAKFKLKYDNTISTNDNKTDSLLEDSHLECNQLQESLNLNLENMILVNNVVEQNIDKKASELESSDENKYSIEMENESSKTVVNHVKEFQMGANSMRNSNVGPSETSDLEKWLDDFLES